MRRTSGVLLVIGVMLLVGEDVSAQPRFVGDLRGLVSVTGVERTQGESLVQLDGTLIGLTAAFRVGFLELGLRYAEGSIEQDAGGQAQDLVMGELQLRVQPVSFFQVGIGPHARSFVSDGTERWLVWEAEARLGAWLIPDIVRGTLDVALGLGGSINSGAEFGSASGVAGGLEVKVPSTPLYVGMGYSVDQLAQAEDTRTDTIEQFFLRVGIWP
jgi:hypothetical protein